MLRKIYIDNFRCLVNFEFAVDEISLLLGPNGCGKSAVLDALVKIQDFLIGEARARDVFRSADLTRWQRSNVQTFELRLDDTQSTYEYHLSIEHHENGRTSRVQGERLSVDGVLVVNFKEGMAQLYDHQGAVGPEYPNSASRSILASVQGRPDDDRALRFIEALKRIVIVRINPSAMLAESGEETPRLTLDAGNFSAWYRYLSLGEQRKAAKLAKRLAEVLDGFDSFAFEEAGRETWVLNADFTTDGSEDSLIRYRLDQLSEGQRALMVLHALIFLVRGESYTLCLDEPENFLALPEIQPWLTEVHDMCGDGPTQALLISHHPELIDYFEVATMRWFDREPNRPVRVQPVERDGEGGLPLSELVARGWLK